MRKQVLSSRSEHDGTLLHPPQFSLRALLSAVAAVSLLFAVMHAVGMIWATALAVLLLLVACHVAGNAIGTRLRDGATQASDNDPERPLAAPASRPAESSQGRLSQKHPICWMSLLSGGLGAVFGGLAGGGLVAALYWDRITIAAVTVSGLASAVLGALAGFLAACFLRHTLGTWSDMWREHQTHLKPFARR